MTAQKLEFPKEVGKAEAQIDLKLTQAQQAAQKAYADAKAKCEAKKMTLIDEVSIKNGKDFTCVEKIVADSDKK